MEWIDTIDSHSIDNINNMDRIEDNTGFPFVKNSDGVYEWAFNDVTFSSGKVFQNFRLTFDMSYKGLYRKYDENESHVYRATHSFIELRTPFVIDEKCDDVIIMNYVGALSSNREILQLFLKGLRIASSSIGSEENIYHY